MLSPTFPYYLSTDIQPYTIREYINVGKPNTEIKLARSSTNFLAVKLVTNWGIYDYLHNVRSRATVLQLKSFFLERKPDGLWHIWLVFSLLCTLRTRKPYLFRGGNSSLWNKIDVLLVVMTWCEVDLTQKGIIAIFWRTAYYNILFL